LSGEFYSFENKRKRVILNQETIKAREKNMAKEEKKRKKCWTKKSDRLSEKKMAVYLQKKKKKKWRCCWA